MRNKYQSYRIQRAPGFLKGGGGPGADTGFPEGGVKTNPHVFNGERLYMLSIEINFYKMGVRVSY